ncbi:MAG: tyrosine-type recombinase/integrase [Micrococcales bacterium]|nr:tyrosine-type recombinase/integrase [Micrococcales bacterium]
MRDDEQDTYYCSAYAGQMAEFVRFKRAQGLKYRCETGRLRELSRFLADHHAPADQATVDRWCALRPHEQPGTQRLRISAARQFFGWLAARGEAAALPTPTRRRNPKTFVPYVFTHGEIGRFFAAADQAKARTPSVMATVAPVLFRLLYGCGLRIGEALNLDLGDVDLVAGCLTVRHAKYDQDRLVPMSATLAEVMRAHARRRPTGGSRDTGRFFVHRDGRPISPDVAYTWFRTVLWSAGISYQGRGHGPRMHDLRHTFAVHALKAMTDDGTDVHCALPVLSTYLGHSTLAATGQYVRLTQDLFPDVIAKTNPISAYVIPGDLP